VLTITPPKLPACVQSQSIQCTNPAVIISLVDKNQLPSAAISDITVYLSSSLPNVAFFLQGNNNPYPVTIKAGKAYAVVNITSTATPGTTAITASSAGLASVTASLTTVEPSGFPAKLNVFVSPSQFLEDQSFKGVVRAELVDDAGIPAKAITPVTVSLSSSNLNVTLDQTSVTIPAGSLYADGTFNSGGLKGTAIITGSATGFQSGHDVVTISPSCTANCGPASIGLRIISGSSSGNLPADGQNYDVLEVSLATQSGTPAVAPGGGVTVQLSSSKPGVASFVNDLVIINSGQESAMATITTTSLEGTSSLTATSPGLVPQTIDVSTKIPAPSKLGMYVAPPSISSYPGQLSPILVVQLQDNSGNPARARQDTSIVVSPSNKTMISNPINLVIPTGSDYAFTTVHATGPGLNYLTASTQGMTSAVNVPLTIAPSPLTISLTKISPISLAFFNNESATMLLSVSFLGQPLNGVNVTWATNRGAMTPPSTYISQSGSTESVFDPSSSGSANITATLSAPAIGTVTSVYILYVNAVPVKPPPSFLQVLQSVWYYIAAAVVAVVAAAYYLFRMRRKKQRAEIEAGFEVV
jgi:hypothetical protein